MMHPIQTRHPFILGGASLTTLGLIISSVIAHSLPQHAASSVRAQEVRPSSVAESAPDSRLEISSDGWAAIEFAHDAPSGAGSALGGSSVPFGAEPDWDNADDAIDPRIQVGEVVVADMNSNGLNDLVVGCYNSQSFPPYEDWRNRVYYNQGGELESTPSWLSTDEVSTGHIAVGDISNNGHLDVFAANGGFAMAPSVIYFNDSSGLNPNPGWQSSEPGNAWNNGVVLVDLNNSGYLDAVTVNQGNSQQDPHRPMFAFMNTEDGNNSTLETVPSWQSAESSIQGFITAGDVTNNGYKDIAVSKWSGFQTAVYRNTLGIIGAQPAWTIGNTNSEKGVALGDVDGDGLLDLAVGSSPTTLYANQGSVQFTHDWSATGDFFGHNDMLFADVTGNAAPDLIEIHFSSRWVNISANENDALTEAPAWAWQGPSVGTAVAVGDINGDGEPDLVVGNSGEPALFVFYHQATDIPGDINGDGEVNVDDLLIVLNNWGKCENCADCPADLTDDCSVNVDDLLTVLNNWG